MSYHRSGRRRPLLGTARRAAAVEVEAGIVDLESHVPREAVGDRPDVGLVDLLDAATTGARKVMVVLGQACDVGVHVAVLLQTSGDPRFDERLERAKDGCSSDPRLPSTEAPVQLDGRHLPARSCERVGHEDSLAGHPLTDGREPVARCKACSIHIATLAQPRLRIMWR